MTAVDVVRAYRHLYRNLLRAVQYSSPARYIARDQLRRAFREGGSQASLNNEGVKRTIWFLEAAAREKGLEHKVLKNLIRVKGERNRKEGGEWKKVLAERKRGNRDAMKREGEMGFAHYDRTVRMLNESMGLCLR